VLFKPNLPPSCGDGAENTNSIFGCLLIIVSQVFSATQMIVEEKIMKGYKCHPLRAVGWEGVWGTSVYTVMLIIFQFISCDPTSTIMTQICSQDDTGAWKVENSLFALRQIGDSGALIALVTFYVFNIAVYNYLGVSLSKYSSSASRAVTDTLKTILIWLFFLMPFISECQREHFSFLQLAGFVLLVLGSVIFNEVLVIPFCGLGENTKDALRKKKLPWDDNTPN